MSEQRTPERLTLLIGQYGDAEFVAADGRTMFEVRARKDGRSIEVRAVNNCKVNGRIYSTSLQVAPQVTNVIYVSTVPYDEQ